MLDKTAERVSHCKENVLWLLKHEWLKWVEWYSDKRNKVLHAWAGYLLSDSHPTFA